MESLKSLHWDTDPTKWDTRLTSVGSRRQLGGSSVSDRVELPGPGHTLQFGFASIIELDTRANDEVLHGARDQYVSGTGELCHPCGDMERQPTKIVSTNLAFSGVQPGAQFDPE